MSLKKRKVSQTRSSNQTELKMSESENKTFNLNSNSSTNCLKGCKSEVKLLSIPQPFKIKSDATPSHKKPLVRIDSSFYYDRNEMRRLSISNDQRQGKIMN